MDKDTTEFPMTAAVQPKSPAARCSTGPAPCWACKGTRMNDVASLMATNSVPQTVNFGIKGDVAARGLRVNRVEPKTSRQTAALKRRRRLRVNRLQKRQKGRFLDLKLPPRLSPFGQIS